MQLVLGFSPDNTILASASWDHTARLRQFADGRFLQGYVTPARTCANLALDFALAPDGILIATASRDVKYVTIV